MRVVSLVPSWTETLLECGIEVVARTRYCIHPGDRVCDIPAIGGTKAVNWEGVEDVDLVLFDREENTKKMVEECPFPWLATHIQSVSDVAPELRRLNEKLKNAQIEKVAGRWQKAAQKRRNLSWRELPGVIEWILPLPENIELEKVVYIIWHKPWMAASRETFIGSVFEILGLEISSFAEKYPELNLEQFDPTRTLLLFSSEPYPFEQKREVIEQLNFPSVLLDGECYSWFGVRSLFFLEKIQANG